MIPGSDTQTEVKELGMTLLNIGAVLMSSGANTGRIRITINRIAESFGYKTELLISHRTILLSLHQEGSDEFFSSLKRTSPHGANFKVVSGISRMSWAVVEEKWSVEQIRAELDRLVSLPHYPRWLILVLIGLAGASFCRLNGGDITDMFITFTASMVGLFVRQETVKKGFNTYLCIYLAALAATLVAGLPIKFGIGHEPAFATSVLFLIPGVPLINAFSDMIDGNLQIGLVRGLNGLILAFAIALGLFTSFLIYKA
ncbi:threonine/serine exporter family protein [Chitinophagaceae bacterium LB-8]|uniref:Threonine/serine exporter family protein n=1 Tax=Paraflavisolibacter caeni TaxID=2982496 RepID=A0A9X2XNG2_9BACT|nr:threonine/serine exporter family protein [Paraflavisolibacter caeni]MCU7548129.1 threonine/serine exporter family protein [Paraflavisolibacter caeni]